MRTHLNPHNILFQQGRKDGSCYAFVLHEVLEHDVVDGICYCHFVIWEYDMTVQMYGYFLKLQNKSGKKKKNTCRLFEPTGISYVLFWKEITSLPPSYHPG
jgi:hypothetical protein